MRRSPLTAEERAKLYQKLRNLEQEWEDIRQPRKRAVSPFSTDHSNEVDLAALFDNSPRSLMLSLQAAAGGGGGEMGCGRRRPGMGFGEREEIYGGGFDLGEESEVENEVKSASSQEMLGSSSSSCLASEKVEGKENDGEVKRIVVVLGWFRVVVMVISLAIIVALRCNGGGFGDESQVILVPT